MKKLLLIMAAALMMMTQCRKQETMPVTPSAGRPVEMTVTVGPGSKTDIASTGGITWSTGDKLYVGDGSKYIGYLTLAGGVGTQTGTFTGGVGLADVEEGDNLTFHFYYLGSADHTSLSKGAEFVEVDFSSQDITKDGNGKLTNASLQHVCYGRANGTVIGGAVTDINVMLVSKVAIAHFNFKKGDADYAGALTLGGTNIWNKMTVNFNSEVFACTGTKGDISLTNTTSSEKYVMLVPTEETTVSQALTFTGAGDNVSGSYTLKNGIEANKFYGLTGAIAVTLEAAAAPKFSVGENTTVEFAPGNLYWDGSAFKFEANQWSFESSWNASHVSHFYWSMDAAEATKDNFNWAQSMSTEDVFFTNSSSFQVAGETAGTWRTLSAAEWDYLLNTRCNNNASSLRAWKDLGNGVKGLVILPDGTKNPSTVMGGITSTADLASSGAVFLPASGNRRGTDVSNVGSYGYYWSSTPLEDNEDFAYYVYFYSGVAYTYIDSRINGHAVRLVR